MKTFLALLVILAMFIVGCSGNTVYDGDRQLQEQNSGAAATIQTDVPILQDALTAAAGALASPSTTDPAIALAKVAAAQAVLPVVGQAAGDIKANSDLELRTWGNPKAQKPYTPQNSDKSRSQSTQDHSEPWYVTLGKGVLGAVVGIGSLYLTAQGIPGVSNLFAKPALAALGKVFQTATNIQTKADATPNDTIHLSDIEAELAALASDPTMKPYVGKLTDALHLGSLLPQTPPASAPVAPAPAPTPAPVAIAPATDPSTKPV